MSGSEQGKVTIIRHWMCLLSFPLIIGKTNGKVIRSKTGFRQQMPFQLKLQVNTYGRILIIVTIDPQVSRLCPRDMSALSGSFVTFSPFKGPFPTLHYILSPSSMSYQKSFLSYDQKIYVVESNYRQWWENKPGLTMLQMTLGEREMKSASSACVFQASGCSGSEEFSWLWAVGF